MENGGRKIFRTVKNGLALELVYTFIRETGYKKYYVIISSSN